MDSLMFFHANSSLEELSVIDGIINADISIDISKSAEAIDNSFSIEIAEKSWEADPIRRGDYVYIPGTEWGGEVSYVEHSTKTASVKIQGVTWRGLLFERAIEPPTGEAYFVIDDMDANEAIRQVASGTFGSLVVVDTGSAGTNVSAQWRYQSVATGLHSAFMNYGMRLNVVFDNVNAHVILSAAQVNTMTDAVEISQDYGVDFVSSEGSLEAYNHCLGLGSGELTERMILNLYYKNGSFFTDKPTGWDDTKKKTLVFDYPNAETESDLLSSMLNALRKYTIGSSLKVDSMSSGINVDLGDVIGVRDRLTGMVGEASVVRKILSIKDGETSIEMEVE